MFLKPYKNKVALMLFLLFAQVIGTLYIPTLSASIINNGIANKDLNFVFKTGAIMLGVALVTALLSTLGTYVSTWISTVIGKDIRSAMFRKIQDYSVDNFNEVGAASMITRSTSDVTVIQQTFSIIVEMLLPVPFMTVAGLILAFQKNVQLAYIILGLMLFVIVAVLIVAKRVVPIFEKLQTVMDRINKTVRESIIGVRVIRAFNRSSHEEIRMNETFDEYADNAIRANKFFAYVMPLVMAVMSLCTLLILWFGGKQVAAGNMLIGDIMAVIEYAMLILMYMIMGVAVMIMIPRAQTSVARINEILNFNTNKINSGGNLADATSDAKVEFRNVTFKYHNAEAAVLHDISFSAHKGHMTAIIGGTGSGKSTIASLLMRFYDIQNGHIFLDGTDIKQFSDLELRARIGYVPQKAFLFSGTIADNLRHGRKDATETEMYEAARIAQIEEFVKSREEGLRSRVSQGGSNFSGGQKQRLSIARAVIKKPEIFIFDDSFSALDFKTDAKLRAALKNEIKDSAMIVVAQRISTIIDADEIVVLDEGYIVGKGTHKELMQNCSVYQQIAQSQLSEEELA